MLAQAQDSGQRLVSVNDESQDAVETRLLPLEEAFEILHNTVVERLSKLKIQLLESQELETALSDVMKWMVSVEKLQGKQEAISLRPAKLQKQHLENEVSILFDSLYDDGS